MNLIDKAKEDQVAAISSKIKHLRNGLGLNQVEFAKRAGIGLRFLRKLEQGKMTLRLDKLFQVVNFLGYHLELKRNNYSEPDQNG